MLVVVISSVQNVISSESQDSAGLVISQTNPLFPVNEDGLLAQKGLDFDLSKLKLTVHAHEGVCQVTLGFEKEIGEILAYKMNSGDGSNEIKKDDLILSGEKTGSFEVEIFETPNEGEEEKEKCKKLWQSTQNQVDNVKQINSKISEIFGKDSKQNSLKNLPLEFVKYPFEEITYSELQKDLYEIFIYLKRINFFERFLMQDTRKDKMLIIFKNYIPKLDEINMAANQVFKDFCIQKGFVRSKNSIVN